MGEMWAPYQGGAPSEGDRMEFRYKAESGDVVTTYEYRNGQWRPGLPKPSGLAALIAKLRRVLTDNGGETT